MANPEKLNLWDRIFNRYKRTVHDRGSENWNHYEYGARVFSYSRQYIEYLVTDRVTGSETIEREYLN